MPDEVTLDVTTIEENVTVETTAGDVVEIQVVAPTGPTGATGPAGPNSVTSATTSDYTAELNLLQVNTGVLVVTDGVTFETLDYNFGTGSASAFVTALGTFNSSTATALQNSRNIFGIAFNGTANVTGDATNTGHFASIPAGGQAGHFVTLNGTAPTVVAGRSAWWSDGSGNPSFRNGTGTAVTLVKSSELGTNVANFLATPTSANLASALTDENGTGGGFVRAEGATLTSPTLVGTPVFNATDYTYGTGAGTQFQAALINASGIGNVFCYDEFMGQGASSGVIGELGWGAVGTVAFRGSELNHPGIYRISSTGTGVLGLNYLIGSTGADGFNGLTIESVFRIGAITNCRHTFGIGYIGQYQSNGYRGITFDPANSPNWRLHHRTSAGADTFTDTGKAAVANEWVKVKLTYASGLTTCEICTTSSPTPSTVTNAGAYTTGTAAHSPQWVFQSTSGTQTLDVDAFLMHGITTRL